MPTTPDDASRQSQLAQKDRFEQAARELGVELDEDKLKEALRKVAGASQAEAPAEAAIRKRARSERPSRG